MSIKKTVPFAGSHLVVSNEYGHTSIHSFSGNRYGPSVILTFPNESVTDLVAALLDVQEDNLAEEAASHD